MLFEVEASGKTVEKAVENALFELKAVRDDVDIKVLEQGGLFKKAKVLVSISDDAREKYEKRYEKREELKEELNEEVGGEKFLNSETESKESSEEAEAVIEIVEIEEEIELPQEKTVSNNNCAENFIKGFVEVSKCGEEVDCNITEDEIKLEIKGSRASELIGYRGECLNALQYIANIIENENRQSKIRVVLDIENYKSKREETLKGLAKRMANKVLKTNKSVKLEPMCANDRRIIHSEIQNYEGVTTASKGNEPNRYLIISPVKNN